MKYFSVIIPAYNCATYLGQTLDSVLNQSFSDFEVIIIDDGSTDNTKVICEQFASRDARIQLLSKNNEGVSSARNEGLRRASGTYLLFLDADDLLADDVMLNIYTLLKDLNYTPDIIFGTYERFDELSQKKYKYSFNFKTDLTDVIGLDIWPILFGCEPTFSAPIMTQIYRTELLQNENIIFDINLFVSEDHDWRLNLLSKTVRYYATEVCLYYYRLSNPLSVTNTPYNIRKYKNSFTYLERWFEKSNTEVSIKKINHILKKFIAQDYANHAINIYNIKSKDEIRDAIKLFETKAYILQFTNTFKYKFSFYVYLCFGPNAYIQIFGLLHRIKIKLARAK